MIKNSTFVMLVNYYYIFGLKKSAGNGAFFTRKIKRLIHNQHKPIQLTKKSFLGNHGSFLF